nr:MarR family transcriptional regulator [Oscillospiraceae bacterium]
MDCWKNAVGPRIKRVNNVLDFWRTQDMERLGLTSTQGYLLGWLTRNADRSVTPSELGRSFKLSQPTISGILQRLEAKGFVTMEADSNDRRRKYVRT